MTEQECLAILPPPGAIKAKKFGGGVIQILVTSSCNLGCGNCTQGSQLRRKHWEMSPEQFEQAVLSLNGYHGVRGLFGGNPTVSKHFPKYCEILRKHVPKDKCGIWCNHPLTLANARMMRETFSPSVSNLNVHLKQDAFDMFKAGWPESMPFGLNQDSRHSPPYVALKDLVPDEAERWRLISTCDIAHFWSALIGVFRGQLRAWFCELAGAQSILHQDEPDYPDTGLDPTKPLSWDYITWRVQNKPVTRDHEQSLQWWQLPMFSFREQVRKHCHECGIPLRGHGVNAQADDSHAEQVSETHKGVYKPKRPNRRVELVTVPEQLGKPLGNVVRYLQNATG